jgi:hypothetical protein
LAAARCDLGLMKNPGTPEQLADAIESLVSSYMDEVRLAAQRAVERSLTRGSVSRPPSKVSDARRAAPKSRTARRSRTELDESDGRVRSVGERHLTRYFPAVVRGAAGKE